MFDGQRAIQIGVVVKNVDAAIEYYEKNFGFGPFTLFDLDDPTTMYYGKEEGQHLKIAMCKMGTLCLELIECISGKSVHADFLEEHGEGIDHICFQVDSIDDVIKEFEGKGFKYIEGDGARFAYIDADKVGGVKFEFVQFAEGVTMQGMLKE